MKAEETRKRLAKELNQQLKQMENFSTTSSFSISPHGSLFKEKPKMFEPRKIEVATVQESKNFFTIPAVKGMAFKEEHEGRTSCQQPTEIYDMQAFIRTNPENMRTLSVNSCEIKEQTALIKKKEWQDILFGDVNWNWVRGFFFKEG